MFEQKLSDLINNRGLRAVFLLAVIALSVTGLVSVVLLAVFGSGRAEGGGLATQSIKPYRRTLEVLIESNGRLSARSTVTVGSQISGEILRVAVDFNDEVTKGQVVAEINPSRHVAQAQSARAALKAAQSRLHRAHSSQSHVERGLERAERLSESQLLSVTDVESARDRVDEARSWVGEVSADVRRLEAAVENAHYELAQTLIRSPVSGVVLERLVEPGQTVAASFETPALFRIAEDLSEMIIELEVDEADIGSVQLGQRVSFKVDSYPARDFHGRVVQKRLAPSVKGNNAKYPVVVAVANAEKLLLPGMLADARVAVNRRENVLTVPNEYIAFGDYSEGIPSAGVLKSALVALGDELGLTVQERGGFNRVVEAIDLSPSTGSSSPDAELAKFFGAEVAANIVVLDDASGDPLTAMRRKLLDELTKEFVDFQSRLTSSKSNKMNQYIHDLAHSQQVEIVTISNGAIKKKVILIGLSDEAATQVVFGLTDEDNIVLGENAKP